MKKFAIESQNAEAQMTIALARSNHIEWALEWRVELVGYNGISRLSYN